MEESLAQIVALARSKLEQTPLDRRLLIGISGPPGSGKTTLSTILTTTLNTHLPNQAIFLPLDGYHFSRAQLDAFPDPSHAHKYRGSEPTFDGPAFLSLVTALTKPVTPTTPTIYAPSFDHALKDPVENAIGILPTHRIVVIEGNYIMLNKSPWSSVPPLLDVKVFVAAPEQILRQRLAKRHLAAGLVDSLEKGEERADFNDIPNGRQIIEQLVDNGDVIRLVSAEDAAWAKASSSSG
ncbi:P-loop containing nucleoside triphosphate hydrolase protein [Triangularia verruculosa]|uniref:P-loop containing nucleoside triphosphate hydrolase protein n=1 Tax=Triangularia verruculosa TaxID=2587418 RepID=A0AAN6XGW9_9PEZI|nr:P-loop containing nucleoside triphosphate hydrolase protein [Triangularia verruculosa]